MAPSLGASNTKPITGFERSNLLIVSEGGLAQSRAAPRIFGTRLSRFHSRILMRDRTSPARLPGLENPYWFATPARWDPKRDCLACARLWRGQSVLRAALAARRNRNARPSRRLSAGCLGA